MIRDGDDDGGDRLRWQTNSWEKWAQEVVLDRTCKFKIFSQIFTSLKNKTYDSDFGMQLFGMVVIICCQTSVPRPKKMHQIHCSKFRGWVENANPPN